MIYKNLKDLRKNNGLTQEQLSEKIGVSRQAIGKWEKGESIPDLYSILELSNVYSITIDTLVRYLLDDVDDKSDDDEGKYLFGTVKVGDRGQIVIPKEARNIFNINPGDYLIFLGDINKGLALAKTEIFKPITDEILKD
ncbi:transcriptional regulator, AbrB family [Anaerofustis stercorihominis DSM 17244]|uniref:Transcriptional regulator, AbrB family n=1 Tax=Anaerofustis stercorihominis DSM 17244 TaxID=445971 RepID=B1C901_9FIRM|nr:helix-turn-helix transcriptional regulator [Anaerofustis stercorihominis]EDS72061.1 transcriptional regulator, AbrB family [Anaerofustis stercorihominis DSM 17244]